MWTGVRFLNPQVESLLIIMSVLTAALCQHSTHVSSVIAHSSSSPWLSLYPNIDERVQAGKEETGSKPRSVFLPRLLAMTQPLKSQHILPEVLNKVWKQLPGQGRAGSNIVTTICSSWKAPWTRSQETWNQVFFLLFNCGSLIVISKSFNLLLNF